MLAPTRPAQGTGERFEKCNPGRYASASSCPTQASGVGRSTTGEAGTRCRMSGSKPNRTARSLAQPSKCSTWLGSEHRSRS